MAETTIPTALAAAIAHHQAGRLREAEELYRWVLARDPNCVPALHNLGTVALRSGQTELAAQLLGRAVELAPQDPALHAKLGQVYLTLGRTEEAIGALTRAQSLLPGNAIALANLANAYVTGGRFESARAAFEQALALAPDLVEAHNDFGALLLAHGNLEAARERFQRACALRPDFVPALRNLGLTLSRLGRLDEARAAFERARALAPTVAAIHHGLGTILLKQGRLAEALACLQQAVVLGADSAEVHNDLAAVYLQTRQLDAALDHCRRALALRPDGPDALNNLATVCKQQGALDAAIECYRRAARPDRPDIGSNLILALHYRFGDRPDVIEPELARWRQQHAASLRSDSVRHGNDRSPDRRLRIGYVSPDLAAHPVGRFLEPLLAAHDRRSVEIFCYSAGRIADAFTAQIRTHADQWREIAALTDDQAADLIRRDQIDVLVDLALHTAGNRLLVFARQPAPVQVSYLGYPGDAGLPEIGYRISDVFLDPPDVQPPRTRGAAAVKLPETYWCYRPAGASSTAPTPLPAATNGWATFGSLNNFCKVTPEVLAAWAGILARVPAARLALHSDPGAHRPRIEEFFAQRGVDPRRLRFIDSAPLDRYLQAYDAIDIALDTFPFPGGTTTCDALWRGVPVVSLAGPTPVTRAGCSILSNVELQELVATNIDDYVRIAVALASAPAQLAALRGSLRARMEASPLMDRARFARHLEAAYRAMWRRWCASV
jgi:predicted O-linked N-acetylglucosamine transferase (SPINDLY family)